jgi:hypothetical protein
LFVSSGCHSKRITRDARQLVIHSAIFTRSKSVEERAALGTTVSVGATKTQVPAVATVGVSRHELVALGIYRRLSVRHREVIEVKVEEFITRWAFLVNS